jgi:hypothetical protein
VLYTEGGRSTADWTNRTLRYNFWKGPVRELCRAVWFVQEKESGGASSLIPVTNAVDAESMETLYLKAVAATSSLGPGIDAVLSESIPTADGRFKIQVGRVGDVLTMRQVPTGLLSGLVAGYKVLQRGYGVYTVPGADDEDSLGPVRHLVLCVHGIGEAWFGRDEINVAGLVEQTNVARRALARQQVQQYKECEKQAAAAAVKGTTKVPSPLVPPPNRIELVPIEWYHHVHDDNSALMQSLQATTLPTIPALRAIANDVVLDVLLYLTPAFGRAVLQAVTAQITLVYAKFCAVHADFVRHGGTVSLVGHSLGSVICWDLLALLQRQQSHNQQPTASVSVKATTVDAESAHAGSQTTDAATTHESPDGIHPASALNSSETVHNDDHFTSYGPTLTRPLLETIPFVPDHTLFLGSPLGLFLSLRGAHLYFDSLRDKAGGTAGVPRTSPFTLPTKSLYNIFHPRYAHCSARVCCVCVCWCENYSVCGLHHPDSIHCLQPPWSCAVIQSPTA